MCSIIHIDISGTNYDFPVVYDTFFNKYINISKLRENTGFITFDPGFKNTSITKSSISFINGDKGELLYRGYSIEDLTDKCSFLETIYLILNGELPNIVQLKSFSKKVRELNFINKEIYQIIEKFPKFYHPMEILSSLTHILTTFENYNNLTNNEEMYLSLLAKFPMLAAITYRKKFGLPLSFSKEKICYTSNILKMFFSSKNKSFFNNKIVIDSLDKLFILHADHEQNCSTTTVRLLGTAHVGLFSSISAGITALWGRLHGGANQAVIEMLEYILKSGGNIKKWINKAKNKKDPFRLMGFGHRIYKSFDPRAKIAKKLAENLLNKLEISDPILEIAKNIEEQALKDSYFIEKKLYPNIDFYSGIIYKAIGIPKDMFTVMFAIGRLPGWIAHWKETISNKDPLCRPRQVYTGYKKRNIVRNL
ncbi:citrate synthase [Blattabacterium cuenoti]|uniref:citrate synthase n=1 Tax=Blattabacterium cuenoti TaxID=1653831 RepID=UPI00163CD4BC|nr:citrate synthase [Blattabacterium cuenoti]